MLLLVRKEITDFFEDIGENLERHILTIFQHAERGNFPAVTFNVDNSTIWDIKDENTIHYVSILKVDTKDILKVSSLLADGFIHFLRGYFDKVEELLIGR
jgi:hypothetical protein